MKMIMMETKINKQWQQWGCDDAAWSSNQRDVQTKSFLDNIITITNTSLASLPTTIYINQSTAIISQMSIMRANDTQRWWRRSSVCLHVATSSSCPLQATCRTGRRTRWRRRGPSARRRGSCRATARTTLQRRSRHHTARQTELAKHLSTTHWYNDSSQTALSGHLATTETHNYITLH